jgi:hypothetical protein
MLGAFPHRTHGRVERFHVTAESALLTTGASILTLLIVVIMLFALFGSRAF